MFDKIKRNISNVLRVHNVTGNSNVSIAGGIITIDGNVVDQNSENAPIVIKIAKDAMVTIESVQSLSVDGDINGNVSARQNISCDNITGNLDVGGNLSCDDIKAKSVVVGGNLSCDTVNYQVQGGSLK